jgi:WD40 repeat protein
VLRASPDGKWVAISSGDNSLFLWNLASGRLSKLALAPGGGSITDFAFSPDSKEVAILDVNAERQSATTLWALGTNAPRSPFFSTGTGGADSTFFSQDGTFLASVCSFCTPVSGALIDLRQHQPQLFVHLTDLDPNEKEPLVSAEDVTLNPSGSLLAWEDALTAEVTVRDLTPADWEQQACQILTLSLQECATASIPSD